MGLINPGPSWAHWSDNLGSTPTSDGLTYGTGVTAGASNADGSSVGVLSALGHDCEYLVLGIAGFAASTANGSTLLDILIDPAGGTSWASDPLISDLLAGFTSVIDMDGSGILGIPLMYHFPLWVPAGASLGARARTAHTSSITGRVVVYAAGGNRNPGSWWCGQKVETVGTFNAAASIGQQHTPGASGAYSSWASLGSTLGQAGGAVQWAVQGPGSSSASGKAYRYEFGAGSTQIGPCLHKGIGGLEVATHFFPGPIFYNFPAATQLQVRGTAGAASPQALDCAAYVVH